MFTGIIETLGEIAKLEADAGNLHIHMKSSLTSELKIDQSVAHNGVCLTVVSLDGDKYTVTAIEETLQKTSLGNYHLYHLAKSYFIFKTYIFYLDFKQIVY